MDRKSFDQPRSTMNPTPWMQSGFRPFSLIEGKKWKNVVKMTSAKGAASESPLTPIRLQPRRKCQATRDIHERKLGCPRRILNPKELKIRVTKHL